MTKWLLAAAGYALVIASLLYGMAGGWWGVVGSAGVLLVLGGLHLYQHERRQGTHV